MLIAGYSSILLKLNLLTKSYVMKKKNVINQFLAKQLLNLTGECSEVLNTAKN